jgi:hypothetical protein
MHDEPRWKTIFINTLLTMIGLLVLLQAFVVVDWYWHCRYKHPRCLSSEGP